MAMTCKKISTALNYSSFRHAKRLSSMTPVSLIGPPDIYQLPIGLTEDIYELPALATEKRYPSFRSKLLTENSSPTLPSSGNPCLDFFFHVVPDTPSEILTRRLQLAWEHDPLKALKLVCNLRGVKGTGKSDRKGGYTAALWLHNHHPKTLACNVDSFADFGYSKDLLQILFRILEDPDARKLSEEKRRWHANYSWEMSKNKVDKSNENESESNEGANQLAESNENTEEEIESKLKRKVTRIQRARRVVERFNSDPDFKFLHDRVSDHFAKLLRSDMEMLSAGETSGISLAAKWCPTLDCTYDRVTLLCETIAKKVFPRDEYPEYEGVEEAHYAYQVRYRLKKKVLIPLRKALELPEVYITANDWGSVPYHRVASVAMAKYKQKFYEHDEERFQDYLVQVMEDKAKIASGALLPHKIIAELSGPDRGQVAELQWKTMVEGMSKKGKLNNCLAICNVSESMKGIPIQVSVALGVLVSELSDEPWKGKVITFSANPKLQIVEGNSLREKTEFVRRMEWGGNTDFQKVFDLLLQVAVDGKLKPEQMIKRLFVFSDMEFDQDSMPCEYFSSGLLTKTETYQNRTWDTEYEAIVKKFTEKGYGDCVPEIVFWNLRDTTENPMPSNKPGVVLVSGFSKNLMRLFLEEGGKIDPVTIMEAAISGQRYKELQVFD